MTQSIKTEGILKNRLPRFLSMLIVVFLAFLNQVIVAQHIWVGSTNQNWHEPLNWDKKTVPKANSNVVIGQGKVVFVRANKVNRARAIRHHGSLTIDRNATLSVYQATSDGIECHGDIITNGTIHIIRPGGSGIFVESGGVVEIGKAGVLSIDTCDAHGIENEGLLSVEGKIEIDSAGQHGLDNLASGILENTGEIKMNCIGENGINSYGSIVNNGDIEVNHAMLNGVNNKGQYLNEGTTIINYAEAISFSNTDTLINEVGGSLECYNGNQGIQTEYLENRGAIVIEDMDSLGIFYSKDFDNFGAISIVNVKEAAIMMDLNTADRHTFHNMATGSVDLSFITGDALVLHKHRFSNAGTFVIDSTTGFGIGDGFLSKPIINDGTIEISRTGLRAMNDIDSLINNGAGKINIFNISSAVSAMIDVAYFLNNGKVTAKDINGGTVLSVNELINTDSILIEQSVGSAIGASSLNNEVGGYIFVSDVEGNGVSSGLNSFNKGEICILNVSGGTALSSYGLVNESRITLKGNTGYAISSSAFVNNDTILINGRFGITVSDDFINETNGYIFTDSASIQVGQDANAFVNKGLIRTGGAISTWGDVVNDACGQIYTSRGFTGFFGGSYINYGYTYQNAQEINLGITVTNYGVYQDINGSSNHSGFTDNGISLDSILGPVACANDIAPILIGLNDSLISVSGITTDSLGDISAGTFDIASNTFLPNNSVGSLSTLYIQFLMPSGCTVSVPLYFENAITCDSCPVNVWTGDGGTTDWFNSDNWSLDMIPQDDHDVRILHDAIVDIGSGMVGTSKLLEVSANADLRVDGFLEVFGQ